MGDTINDWSIIERNSRGWRAAASNRGERVVYDLAVSSNGLHVLWKAGSRLPEVGCNGLGEAGLVRARARAWAMVDALKQMGADGVAGSDMGWSAEPGAGGVGMLPRRGGGKGGGDMARKVVVRLLSELPCGEGLSALTLLTEVVEMPDPVPLNERDDPLLPTSVAMVGPRSPLRYGGLFAHTPSVDSALFQSWLPGFDRDVEGPLLPLVLYELLSNSDRNGGGGRGSADLALRIFVEGLCSVMHRSWRSAEVLPVSVSTTMREFLSWFYGERRPRPAEYWPRLMAACSALDREEVRFPYRDPATGESGSRRVVNLIDIPRGPGRLDDKIMIAVFLPPGSETGPMVRRGRLRYWGRKCAPAYRALLSLSYDWYRPGVTRVPGPGGKGWVQSEDLKHYVPYSRERVVELCYPTSRKTNRRELVSRSWAVIRRLEAAGDLRVVGQRILPPPPEPSIKLI